VILQHVVSESTKLNVSAVTVQMEEHCALVGRAAMVLVVVNWCVLLNHLLLTNWSVQMERWVTVGMAVSIKEAFEFDVQRVTILAMNFVII